MTTNKKIAIVTDTNSGMLPHEADAQGIFVLPMPFVVDGNPKLDGIDLSRDEFYRLQREKSNITTSQPSVGEVSEFWRNILNDYDEIVPVLTEMESEYLKVFEVDGADHKFTGMLEEFVALVDVL